MIQGHWNVLIASYLEPEYVERIRQLDARLNVVYEPELLASPRYPADHYGIPNRSPEQETRWRQLLAQADILFDFDPSHRQDLPELAPRARWLQATSAGIGQFVKRMGYAQHMPNTIFTTASGVHAKPLAEFCIMAMLMFNKGLVRMLRDQERKHWERSAGTDLEGQTMAIVGLSKIGNQVACMADAFGMRDFVGAETPHAFPGELYVTQPLGAETLVIPRVGDKSVSGRLFTVEPPRLSGKVWITPDPQRIFLYRASGNLCNKSKLRHR